MEVRVLKPNGALLCPLSRVTVLIVMSVKVREGTHPPLIGSLDPSKKKFFRFSLLLLLQCLVIGYIRACSRSALRVKCPEITLLWRYSNKVEYFYIFLDVLWTTLQVCFLFFLKSAIQEKLTNFLPLWRSQCSVWSVSDSLNTSWRQASHPPMLRSHIQGKWAIFYPSLSLGASHPVNHVPDLVPPDWFHSPE